MYKFVCSGKPSHTSYSSAKEPTNPICPKCGEPIHLVNKESYDKPTRGEL